MSPWKLCTHYLCMYNCFYGCLYVKGTSFRCTFPTLCTFRGVLESDREADTVPWIAVSVWGFEDSPLSWGTCEHGSFMWGDNHYLVLLFRQGQYWTVTSLGSHDTVC